MDKRYIIKSINEVLTDLLIPHGFKEVRSGKQRFEMCVNDSLKFFQIEFLSTGYIRPGKAAVGYQAVYKVITFTPRPNSSIPTQSEYAQIPLGQTISTGFNLLPDRQTTIFIKTQEELDSFKQQTVSYLKKIAIPFMEKFENPYQTLKFIKLNKTKFDLPFRVLNFWGMNNSYYALAISKLCGDVEFQALVEETHLEMDKLEYFKKEWKESFEVFLQNLNRLDPIYKDMYENIW